MDFLIDLDRSTFLAVNGWHSPFFDFVMYWMSEKFIWAPLYIALLIMMGMHYKRKFWIILPLIVLLVTLTDQLSVALFKDVFQRLRPCHDPALDGMVRILNGHCGGSFGFISSHAANSFGVAVFGGLLLKPRYSWILTGLLIWAALISYSRIYLGVHFPGDVIVGAIVGGFIGWIVVLLFRWILNLNKKV